MKEEIKNYKEEKKFKLNLSRQSKLVKEEDLSKWNFKVFGVGSIGSIVTQILAKTGFKSIEVYDMDTVNEENIGPQAFFFEHLKMKKTDAMVDIVKRMTGTDILSDDGMVTKDTEIEIEPNTMYLCFFDSFESRKLVYNKVKNFPCIFVDGRIGKFEMRHYLIDCSDADDKINYEKSFPKDGKEGSELICGMKASNFINTNISSRIVANIINYLSGRTYEKTFIGSVQDPIGNIHVRKVR